MKLVDILAVNLKCWPDHMTHLWISAGNTIYGKNGSFEFEMNGGWDKPEDHRTVSVSRAEWQAAVDALNVPKVVEWDVAGLPPIDVEVEFRPDVHAQWCVATAKYHSLDFSVFSKFGEESPIWNPKSWQFRPIRTAEQVAAEEREKAINEMVFGVCGCEPDGGNTTAFMICGFIYDAGYRKQVLK